MKTTAINLVLLFFLPFVALSQNNCKSRLLFSSSDLYQRTTDTFYIDHIKRAMFKDSVIVKTSIGKKIKFSNSKIWGYEECNGQIYRNYDFVFYQIKQIKSIVIYEITEGGNKGLIYHWFYFSKTLDSPIYFLTWGNIRKQFNDNPCFLGRLDKELKWNEDYSAYDKKNKSYRLMEIYDECK